MTPTPIKSTFSVTATQLVRDLPGVRRLTEHAPVEITSHGHVELVVLNPQLFTQLSAAHPQEPGADWKIASILDTIDMQVLLLDADLNVTHASRAMLETRGMELDQVVGQPGAKLIRTVNERFVFERLSEVIRTGKSEVVVVPATARPDRTIRMTIKPWADGIALFAEDITDREEVRERRVSNQALDTALSEIGGVGVAHVEARGTIIRASQAFANLFGTEQEAMVGARVQNLFDLHSRSVVDEALTAQDSAVRSLEVRYLRDGVTAVPGRLALTPYWDAERHACAALVLIDPAWIARQAAVASAADGEAASRPKSA